MRTAILLAVLGCALAAPVRAQIKAGDTLQIFIRGVPAGEKQKVEGRFVVGASGLIRIPLAEVMVKAKGLSGEQLARKIEAVYREAEIYTHPNIEVVTDDAPDLGGAQVSVGGDVRRSGPIAFRPGMTLLQAIQAAGDLSPFGTKKRIFVTRGEKRWVVDLRTEEGQRFPLQTGDTIVADRKKWHESQ